MSDVQLIEAFGEKQKIQDQMLASERLLADAWARRLTQGVIEPKELLQQVTHLRTQSDRLLRNVIVAHRLFKELGGSPRNQFRASLVIADGDLASARISKLPP